MTSGVVLGLPFAARESPRNSKLNLRRHVAGHEGRGPSHLCPDCGNGFKTLEILKKHQKRLHAPATEVCPLCPPGKSKLYNKYVLQTHISDVHNKRHSCPQCEWRSAEKTKLVEHYRAQHLKYLQFRCKQCDKRFSKESNIKSHIQQVHENNKMRRIEHDFFEKNKDLYEDFKVTEPHTYPSAELVLKVIEQARDQGQAHIG